MADKRTLLERAMMRDDQITEGLEDYSINRSIERDALAAEEQAALEASKKKIGQEALDTAADTQRFSEKYLGSTAKDLEEAQRQEMFKKYLQQKDAAANAERAGIIGQQLTHEPHSLPQHRGGLPAKQVLTPEIISDASQTASHIKPDIETVGREIKPSRLSSVISAIKRNPKLAATIGIAAGTGVALSSSQKDEQSQPTTTSEGSNDRSVDQLPIAVSTPGQVVESKQEDELDGFLKKISHLESSGGRILAHKPIESGPNRGQTAFGEYGILPNTAKEFSTRLLKESIPEELRKKLTELQEISDPDKVNEFLGRNKDVYKALARKGAEHVLAKSGGDALKAAYAWNRGHNLDTSNLSYEDMLQRDPDNVIQRYIDFVNKNPPSGGMAESLHSRSYLPAVGKKEPLQQNEQSYQLVEKPLQPESLPKSTLPLSQTQGDVLSEYRDAKSRSGLIDLISILGKSASEIGAGIAGGTSKDSASIAAPKVDTSVFDQIGKMSDEPVKQFAIEKQLKEEREMANPNSDISKTSRMLVKQAFPDVQIPENTSALQLKNAGLDLSKMFSTLASTDRLNKTLAAKQSASEKRLSHTEKTLVNRALNSAEIKLDRDSVYKTNNNTLQRMNHLKSQLFNEDGSTKDLTQLGAEEAARSINTIFQMSAGSQARASVEALLPKGMEISVANIESWLKSEPQKAKAFQRFIQPVWQSAMRIAQTAARENISRIQAHLESQSQNPVFTDKPGLLEAAYQSKINQLAPYLSSEDKKILEEGGTLSFSGIESTKKETPKDNYTGIKTINNIPYWFKNGSQLRALTEDEKQKHGGR